MRSLLAAAAAALLLSACSTSTGSATDDEDGKYDQTWATPYGDTTCADWTNKMTKHENFVFAADVLVGQWEKDAGGEKVEELPTDALVNDFGRQITEACSTKIDIGAGTAALMVYEADRAVYKR